MLSRISWHKLELWVLDVVVRIVARILRVYRWLAVAYRLLAPNGLAMSELLRFEPITEQLIVILVEATWICAARIDQLKVEIVELCIVVEGYDIVASKRLIASAQASFRFNVKVIDQASGRDVASVSDVAVAVDHLAAMIGHSGRLIIFVAQLKVGVVCVIGQG